MNKKAECNIAGIFGMAVLALGIILNNNYMAGAGIGITTIALHFRIDYLKTRKGE